MTDGDDTATAERETDGGRAESASDEREGAAGRDRSGSGNADRERSNAIVSRRAMLASAGALAGGGVLGTGRASAHPGEGRGGSPEDPGGGSGSTGPSDDEVASPLPGPPVLYEEPASAPQFEKCEGWSAEPLLVSGADAYVDGEYLFQDFVYDDKGADTTDTQAPPYPAPDHHDFGPMTGDVVYPTDRETYANNAADLLEVRTRLAASGEVVYRFTLNTMTEPGVAALALGIVEGTEAGDGSATDWGYGLGELGAPAEHVLVTWGEGAELDGERLDDDRVSVSAERNQVEVRVPLTPGEETWRHYLVSGLWDDEAGQFEQVRDQPTETEPGGAHGKSPPPVFNVGFRRADQEPLGSVNGDPDAPERELEETAEELTGSRGVGYGHWREDAQAKALADRDVSQFNADVDFGKLARRETDVRVPETGYLNRLYASRHDLGRGIGPYTTESGDDSNGEQVLLGNVVPYSVYVPDGYDGDPTPLHVHLHSLSGGYNQYAAWTPDFVRQVGEENDTLVLTTSGRGPGVPYRDQAELDLFEAWADLRSRYAVDEDRVTIGGYSMGGIGTHQIASKWPDLFAKGFPIAGSIGDENTGRIGGNDLYTDNELIADNQRHVPLLMWQGTSDELVPYPLALKYAQHLRDLGLRHEFDTFPGFDHLTFGYLDEWGPAADFLADATVTRSPRRVTYRRVPRLDNDRLDLVHDHVYWVSDVTAAAADHGFVDVTSLAFGEADPLVERYDRSGTDPAPHEKRGVSWSDALVDPPARNAFDLVLEDVTALTLWVEEAAIDPDEPVTLLADSTHPATVTLVSTSDRAEVTVPVGESEQTVELS